MAEPTFDESIAGMTGPSSQHLGAFGESLKGTGADSWAAYRSLTEQAVALPGIGKSTVDEVARLRADHSLPRDHRYALADAKEQRRRSSCAR